MSEGTESKPAVCTILTCFFLAASLYFSMFCARRAHISYRDPTTMRRNTAYASPQPSRVSRP